MLHQNYFNDFKLTFYKPSMSWEHGVANIKKRKILTTATAAGEKLHPNVVAVSVE